MVVRDLSLIEKKVKALLIEGQTRKTVAKTLRIKYGKVRNISDNLEYLQEIKRIPGCKSPILYYDPTSRGPAASETSQIVGYDKKNQGMIPLSDVDPKTSRVHLNGSYVCDILTVGRVDTIYSATGRLMGWWRKEPSHPKGRRDWYGSFRVEGFDMTFCHRSGANGTETFVIWPQDTLIDGLGAIAKGAQVLLDRANLCLSLLGNYGWRFGDLRVNGRYEAAHVNNPMIARMDRHEVDNDAPVHADTSRQIPELEAFTDSDNDILSYVPEHIRQLYARVTYLEKSVSLILSYDEARVNSELSRLEARARLNQDPDDCDFGGMYR